MAVLNAGTHTRRCCKDTVGRLQVSVQEDAKHEYGHQRQPMRRGAGLVCCESVIVNSKRELKAIISVDGERAARDCAARDCVILVMGQVIFASSPSPPLVLNPCFSLQWPSMLSSDGSLVSAASLSLSLYCLLTQLASVSLMSLRSYRRATKSPETGQTVEGMKEMKEGKG